MTTTELEAEFIVACAWWQMCIEQLDTLIHPTEDA